MNSFPCGLSAPLISLTRQDFIRDADVLDTQSHSPVRICNTNIILTQNETNMEDVGSVANGATGGEVGI